MFSATLKTARVCFHLRIRLGFCLLPAPSSPDTQGQNPCISLGACNSFSKTSVHQGGSHGSSTLSWSCGVEMDGSSGPTTLSSHMVGTSVHQPPMSWALCQLSDWYQVGARASEPQDTENLFPLFPDVWIRVLQHKRACSSPLLPPHHQRAHLG